MRAVGRALGWDRTSSGEPMDLNQSIFAMYTLVKRALIPAGGPAEGD